VIRVYLGHGASGTAASMRPWVDGLRARGIEAHAVDLPKRKAEDAVAAYEAQVPDEPGVVIGGHSFGGRVASLAVAGVRTRDAEAREHPYAGLVCLSYPMHPPGKPENAAARIAHWPAIGVPALLLSGTSDPFARIALLEGAMPALRHGALVTYPGLGHTLQPVQADALDRIAAFVGTLEHERP
jgi:predicted alpha/beta-hydrolase family hydrolase